MTLRDPGPCSRCGQHPAAEVLAASALDYAHGNYESLCGCCLAFEQLRQAEDMAARIPGLRAALAAACDGTGRPPPEIPRGWTGYECPPAENGVVPAPRLAFWAQDFKDVMEWARGRPGRAGGGQIRRPDPLPQEAAP